MSDLPNAVILQVGGAGLLLAVLILRFWRSEGGYGALIRSLREDAEAARRDATDARHDLAAMRELMEKIETQARKDIAALRAKVAELEEKA